MRDAPPTLQAPKRSAIKTPYLSLNKYVYSPSMARSTLHCVPQFTQVGEGGRNGGHAQFADHRAAADIKRVQAAQHRDRSHARVRHLPHQLQQLSGDWGRASGKAGGQQVLYIGRPA